MYDVCDVLCNIYNVCNVCVCMQCHLMFGIVCICSVCHSTWQHGIEPCNNTLVPGYAEKNNKNIII